MSDLVIRRATRHDLPALGRLGAVLMRTHHDFDPQRFLDPGNDPEEGYAWFLGTQLDDDTMVVLVAETPDGVAGYVYAGLEPLSWKELRGPAGFIHDVVVAESARRSGIARHLLDTALAWLREAGAPRVVLWTAAPNHRAHALFAGLGFRTTMLEMTLELDRDR